MTGPIGLVETALYSTLAAGTALIADLGGTAIYNRIAPQSVALPYLIFQWQGGGDENETPHRTRNVVYTVKGVASTLAKAEAIDEEADKLLHGATLTVTGYTNIWCRRIDDVAYVEVDAAGKPVYHTGGQYRIWIAA